MNKKLTHLIFLLTSCSYTVSALAQVAAPIAKPASPAATPAAPATQSAQGTTEAASMIEAARAAQEFVTLIDQGKYAESWTKGSYLFQKTIPQNEWVTALKLARGRLGAALNRTLKDQRPAWNPRGLPAGAYMVVEYNTKFANAPQSGELLTLMQESSGQWKVLTYQVN